MRKFSQIINESVQIKAQDGAIGTLAKQRISQYLKIANKFLSEEAIAICEWLVKNEDWLKNTSKTSQNPLVDFFNAGRPSDKNMQELWDNMLKLHKAKRLIEIPLFMTQEEIDGILSKKVSPDEVFLDFKTEKGRNEIARRYTPLVHKIARSWIGKTAFDYDELVSHAYNGLIWAMGDYGKKTRKQLKREERTGVEEDITKYKEQTFLSFASQMMRNAILDATKNDSRLVRIPVSQQKKIRSEQGFIAKSNTVSGEQPMGNGKGDDGQTLFDIVGGIDNPGVKIDKEELDKLWDQVCKKLEAKFGQKTMDIFYNHFGFGLEDGKKQLTGVEMAAKYGYKSAASITAEVVKVVNFIKKDPKMLRMFTDIYELMREHQEDLDELDQDYATINVNGKIMEDRDDDEKDDMLMQ